MIEDIGFSSISLVIKTWQQAKQSDGFEEKLGIDALLRLFEIEPDTKKIFGFPDGPIKPIGMQYMALLIHGKRVVGMIDSAIALLGPDVDILEDYLSGLGDRHHRVGVRARHFIVLGEALRHVLKDIVGSTWTDKVETAWMEVFTEIAGSIIRSMPLAKSRTSSITVQAVKANTSQ